MYTCKSTHLSILSPISVHVAEQLALPTSDHGVAGSNPAGGEILPEPKRRFIAQSLSCSPFHRLEMTEILLKGRKTLTHPSILSPPRPSVARIHICTVRHAHICAYMNTYSTGRAVSAPDFDSRGRGFFSNLNGASLHRGFHVHPSIVSK